MTSCIQAADNINGSIRSLKPDMQYHIFTHQCHASTTINMHNTLIYMFYGCEYISYYNITDKHLTL